MTGKRLIIAMAWFLLATGAAAAPAPDARMPTPEQGYIDIVNQARRDFAATKSIDARTGVRLGLQINVHEFMGLTHAAQDWVGTYMGSAKAEDGSRSIVITIAPGITIATWDSPYVDFPYQTMVKPLTPLARVLDALTIGQPVTFSADLIGEVVSNDDDMVMRPRIIAVITKLSRLDD